MTLTKIKKLYENMDTLSLIINHLKYTSQLTATPQCFRTHCYQP